MESLGGDGFHEHRDHGNDADGEEQEDLLGRMIVLDTKGAVVGFDQFVVVPVDNKRSEEDELEEGHKGESGPGEIVELGQRLGPWVYIEENGQRGKAETSPEHRGPKLEAILVTRESIGKDVPHKGPDKDHTRRLLSHS